jgi:hypothetical protein
MVLYHKETQATQSRKAALAGCFFIAILYCDLRGRCDWPHLLHRAAGRPPLLNSGLQPGLPEEGMASAMPYPPLKSLGFSPVLVSAATGCVGFTLRLSEDAVMRGGDEQLVA